LSDGGRLKNVLMPANCSENKKEKAKHRNKKLIKLLSANQHPR
jgi:hypothetical protein